jgi:hypothetical protein
MEQVVMMCGTNSWRFEFRFGGEIAWIHIGLDWEPPKPSIALRWEN